MTSAINRKGAMTMAKTVAAAAVLAVAGSSRSVSSALQQQHDNVVEALRMNDREVHKEKHIQCKNEFLKRGMPTSESPELDVPVEGETNPVSNGMNRNNRGLAANPHLGYNNRADLLPAGLPGLKDKWCSMECCGTFVKYAGVWALLLVIAIVVGIHDAQSRDVPLALEINLVFALIVWGSVLALWLFFGNHDIDDWSRRVEVSCMRCGKSEFTVKQIADQLRARHPSSQWEELGIPANGPYPERR